METALEMLYAAIFFFFSADSKTGKNMGDRDQNDQKVEISLIHILYLLSIDTVCIRPSSTIWAKINPYVPDPCGRKYVPLVSPRSMPAEEHCDCAY